MTLLLLGKYKKINNNDYIELLADAYMRLGISVIFEEQNFMFSNFIPDILHIQWPEAIYRWNKLISIDDDGFYKMKQRLKWYKNNNTKIIYTVHNLLPHEDAKTFDKRIYDLVLSYADIVAHHGKSSINIIKNEYPKSNKAKHIIAPHGPYERKILPLKQDAKDKYDLPIDKQVYTNFGLQRLYKGQQFCYDVFKKWSNDKVCFFSVGKLIADCSFLNRENESFSYKQVYKNIPTDEIPEIIVATDVFFLGHLSGLNSGLIALALTYGKPIIFPNIGNFKDQVDGWDLYETYEVGDISSAVNALKRMHSRLSDSSIKQINNKRWLEVNSWENHVNNILKVIDNGDY